MKRDERRLLEMAQRHKHNIDLAVKIQLEIFNKYDLSWFDYLDVLEILNDYAH